MIVTFRLRHAPTLFLKFALLCFAFVAVGLCAILFSSIWLVPLQGWPSSPVVFYVGWLTIYASTIPFLVALYQAFYLLQYIDAQQAFSEQSTQALQAIKRSAIAMSILYWVAMPMVYYSAQTEDAPGLIVIGAAFASAPLVVATFAAVLQKLVASALALEQEVDLTI